MGSLNANLEDLKAEASFFDATAAEAVVHYANFADFRFFFPLMLCNFMLPDLHSQIENY